ncbi:hypothetical protein M426DRAFT_325789 [Hypoxylon sp. CI-4A]|nr:hypothetical protein M426DRAFT_325789 [Hypoxylon sp. CI-4A]
MPTKRNSPDMHGRHWQKRQQLSRRQSQHQPRRRERLSKEPKALRNSSILNQSASSSQHGPKRDSRVHREPTEAGDESSIADRKSIKLVLNGPQFFVYTPQPPDTNSPDANFTNAFTARRCVGQTNYIIEKAAARLKLEAVKGAMHSLRWLSDEKPQKSKPRCSPRCSTFVVVSNDDMKVEIALGSECPADEVPELIIVSADKSSSSRCDVRIGSDDQNQEQTSETVEDGRLAVSGLPTPAGKPQLRVIVERDHHPQHVITLMIML